MELDDGDCIYSGKRARPVREANVVELKEETKESIQAGVEAWSELCSLLEIACAASDGKRQYRRADDYSVVVWDQKPPRELRLEYAPQFRKLRYHTGNSGTQEWTAVDGSQKQVVFETPYHVGYSVEQVRDLVLEQLEKSQF